MKITHVMCIEQNNSRSYINLELFRQIFPICFQNKNYKALYYYDDLRGHINEMSIMPNLLLTEKCAVVFDYEMKHGMMINDKVYIDVLAQEFERMKRKTTPFVCFDHDQMDVMTSYSMIADSNVNITLFNQPCMGAGISSDIYERFLYPFPDKDEFIKLMCDNWRDWKGNEYIKTNERTMGAYSAQQGVRYFMETGRVTEFPSGYYMPLDMEARRNVLKRIIGLVRKGVIQYKFLTSDIDIPETLYFYISVDEKILFIHKVYEDRICRVYVQESGIIHAFMSFFEYIEKKNMLCEGRDVLEYLKDIYKEYS